MEVAIGMKVWTIGMNSKCKKVACRAEVTNVNPADQYGRDCVILTDGIKVIYSSKDCFSTKLEAIESINAK